MSTKIERRYYQVVNVLLAILIAVCIAHVIWVFSLDRSLWLDEAMLMKSVLTRGFGGILEGFFDENQSAPPCYMLTVKLFTVVFGTSEWVLRLYSLLMFSGSAFLVYYISKVTLRFKVPLLAVAIIVALPNVQHYAYEAKPYMGDVFFSLMSIGVYTQYIKQRFSFIWVALILSIFVWFAFGALFMMGGICAYHFIWNTYRLCSKEIDVSLYFKDVLPLVLIALSVALYYFLWALPASTNVPDVSRDNYWTFLNFPLIPRSVSDIKLLKLMLLDFVSTPGGGYVLIIEIIVGVILYFIVNRKTWLALSFLLSAVMIMVVSAMGMYPIAQRLLLSQHVVVWLFVAWSMDFVVRRMAKNRLTVWLPVLLVLPLSNVFASSFDFKEKSHKVASRGFNDAYRYVKSVRTPESKIYIPAIIRPVAQYYMNYSDTMEMFTPVIMENDSLIFGTIFRTLHCEEPYAHKFFPDTVLIQENVNAIKRNKDVYIIMTHEVSPSKPFFEALPKSGLIMTVDTIGVTPVWHCTLDSIGNVK